MKQAYKTLWECEHCGSIFRSLIAVRIHGFSAHKYYSMSVTRWRGTMQRLTFDNKPTIHGEDAK